MTIDQRLPALRALRDRIHDEVQFARHKAELASREGRPDVNGLTAQWQMLEASLFELDYVIEYHSEKAHNDNRIELNKHIIVAASILYLIVMIPVFYLLIWGH